MLIENSNQISLIEQSRRDFNYSSLLEIMGKEEKKASYVLRKEK